MIPCLLAQAPFMAGFNLQPILQAQLVELGEFNLRAEGVYRSFFVHAKCSSTTLQLSLQSVPQGKIVISVSIHVGAIRWKT